MEVVGDITTISGWADLSWIFSFYAEIVGAIGGTLAIALAVLKIREYRAARPKTITKNLAPRLRELRRMLDEYKIADFTSYYREQFVSKGYERDLQRIAPTLALLLQSLASSKSTPFVQPGSAPKEWGDFIYNLERRYLVLTSVGEIDRVLERAEGA